MVKLQLLVGSATYGITTPTSDTDIYLVGSGSYLIPECDKPHIIKDSKELFVQKALLEYREHPLYLQTLFPAEFLLDTDASKYIVETRENVIRAQLKSVYDSHMTIGKGLITHAERMVNSQPKRIAYGVMFFDTVWRYSQGESFAKAVCPEGSFKEWLIAVRNKEIDTKEVLSVIKEKQSLAESISKFYDYKPDLEFLNGWKKESSTLLTD